MKKKTSKILPKNILPKNILPNNILPNNIEKYSSNIKVNNILTNVSYLMIFIFIILIIYIGYIIHYLNKLKECPCFLEKNKENNSNITYLIVIESIILAIYIIYVLVFIYLIYVFNSKKIGGGIKIMYYISFLLILIIYGFFIYYVSKLSQNISEDCECSKSWIRYLLYIQSFGMFLAIITKGYNLMKLS